MCRASQGDAAYTIKRMRCQVQVSDVSTTNQLHRGAAPSQRRLRRTRRAPRAANVAANVASASATPSERRRACRRTSQRASPVAATFAFLRRDFADCVAISHFRDLRGILSPRRKSYPTEFDTLMHNETRSYLKKERAGKSSDEGTYAPKTEAECTSRRSGERVATLNSAASVAATFASVAATFAAPVCDALEV